MKSTIAKICLTAFMTATLANASAAEIFDVANVVSTTPYYVSTGPRQVCDTVQEPVSGNGQQGVHYPGTIIGGAAGGVIGNQIGKGNGKTVATAAGAVIGALAGNQIGNANSDQQPTYNTRPVQRCNWINDGSQQIGGYDVVYEYAGKTGRMRMNRQPGATIRVGITAYAN